ncbi:MAG: hypothetical protein AB2L20_11865 [Mangrovibacterium sp.]
MEGQSKEKADKLFREIIEASKKSFQGIKTNCKIVHVQLREPFQGKAHYYFGSVAAIYTYLPAEVIGIQKESLYNEPLMDGIKYSNKKCTIRLDALKRKPTKRGFNKQKS